MEIIYRLNEICEYEKTDWEGKKYTVKEPVILEQNICCCNSRDHFKEIMRDMYHPKKIHFINSKKLVEGDIFITIISENCYNTAQYFIVDDYKCACCGKDFKANKHMLKKIYYPRKFAHICEEKYLVDEEEIENMTFCSELCRAKKEKEITDEYESFIKENNIVSDLYVSKHQISKNDGYIYLITKKSTGEFYIGQTKYVPMFRWIQHLKTERFKLENILDFRYEVLEVIPNYVPELLNERESYWINKKRDENPGLCLNIIIPKQK